MIVGVNKCNITALAKEQYNALLWGFSCKKAQQVSMLENYMQYLNCDTVNQPTCYPDNCSNPTIISVCNIQIEAISFSVVGENITFFIDAPDMTGATAPITYEWSYDTTVFDLVSLTTTASTLVLSLKEGKLLSEVVTFVAVEIVDADLCIATRYCDMVDGAMVCVNDYIPCPNGTDFEVTNDPTPFFNIIARGLNSITSGFAITSGAAFSINWGDGIIESFLAGARTPTHIYDTPYTGYIKVSSNDLDDITVFGLGNPSGVDPDTNGLAILTSEISKLTGLNVLSLGSSIFLDGIVTDLPSTLTAISTVTTNLSGTTLQFARTITSMTIQGLNTITGSVGDLPPNLVTFIVWGLNTISGNVLNIPRSVITLNVLGSNTITGTPINLPPNLVLTNLLGNNTMTGDIAGWPSSSVFIAVYGTNTLFGNIANLPAGLVIITVLGNNTISGDIQNIPSTVEIFQITGSNTLSGDLALIPAGLEFFNVISTASTINTYTIGLRTWNPNMQTVALEPGLGGLDEDEVDGLLIELAAQVSSWSGSSKNVKILGGSEPRTAASDAAVLTIQGFGVTVTTE